MYILSADGRFPDSVSPGSQLEEGDHFLAMFPCYKPSSSFWNRHALDGQGSPLQPLRDGSRHYHEGESRSWFFSFFSPIRRWLQASTSSLQPVKHTSSHSQRDDIGELMGGGVGEKTGKQLESPDFDGWPSLNGIDDPDEGYYFTGKLRGKTKLKFKQNSDESTDDNGGVDDSFKDNRWLGDVNKILKHGASCKSLT